MKSKVIRMSKNIYIQYGTLAVLTLIAIVYFNFKFDTKLSVLEILVHFAKQVIGILGVSFLWLLIFSRKGSGNKFEIDFTKYKRISIVFWIIALVVNSFATLYFGPI